jgi:hypothetical protein
MGFARIFARTSLRYRPLCLCFLPSALYFTHAKDPRLDPTNGRDSDSGAFHWTRVDL